jgi:hemerythrin-like metal-binding protein
MSILPTRWDAAQHTLGVASLDGAHREFISQVDALLTASDEEFPALFQALVTHTREHFLEESNLMRDSRFEGLGVHESEHRRVLGELQQLNRGLKQGRVSLVRGYVLDTLAEWFHTHLTRMDNALAQHLAHQ